MFYVNIQQAKLLLLLATHQHKMYLSQYKVDPNKYNHWLQTLNPLKDQQINGVSKHATGYSPVHLDFKDLNFEGLMRGSQEKSLVDGNIGTDRWNYAIGDFSGKFDPKTPGPSGGGDVTQVYLWIRKR